MPNAAKIFVGAIGLFFLFLIGNAWIDFESQTMDPSGQSLTAKILAQKAQAVKPRQEKSAAQTQINFMLGLVGSNLLILLAYGGIIKGFSLLRKTPLSLRIVFWAVLITYLFFMWPYMVLMVYGLAGYLVYLLWCVAAHWLWRRVRDTSSIPKRAFFFAALFTPTIVIAPYFGSVIPAWMTVVLIVVPKMRGWALIGGLTIAVVALAAWAAIAAMRAMGLTTERQVLADGRG
jgi:hypothetical protein